MLNYFAKYAPKLRTAIKMILRNYMKGIPQYLMLNSPDMPWRVKILNRTILWPCSGKIFSIRWGGMMIMMLNL